MRNFKKVAKNNVLVNFFSMVNGVVFIAVFSRMVGVHEFAEWNWLQSAAGLFLITDFYLFLSLQNQVTENSVTHRQAKSSQVFFNLFVIELVLSIGLIAFLVGAYYFLLPTINFGIYQETLGLFCFALGVSLLGMPFLVITAYFCGLGDSDLYSGLFLLKAVLQNVFILYLLWWGISFYVAVSLFFVSSLIILLGIYFYGVKRYKIRRSRISRKTIAITINRMLNKGQGLYWAMLRVLEAIRQNMSLFTGFFYLPIVTIADYALISRANSVAVMVASSILTPLIPRLLVLHTSNDREGMTRIVRKIFYYSLLYAIGSIVFFQFFAGQISSIWSGRDIAYDKTYVLLISLAGVMQMLQSILWSILAGVNRIGALMYCSLISAVVLCAVFFATINEYAELTLPLTIISSSLCFVSVATWYLKKHQLVWVVSASR